MPSSTDSDIRLDDDLQLSLVAGGVTLTHRMSPGESLDLAENLTRRAFRAMLAQEGRLFDEEVPRAAD